MSAYEIYNNSAYDLLSNNPKCKIRENYNNEFIVSNLSKHKIIRTNINSIINIIKQNRSIGINAKNSKSSRSHAIIDLFIQSSSLKTEIRFVDLAGNERSYDSLAKNKYQARESQEINNSLLAFKECIRAMQSNNIHIPFRRSTLTKLLRNYFITKNNIIIIGNISPCSYCIKGTLNTLQYLSLMLKIKPQLKYIPKVPSYPEIVDIDNKYKRIISDKSLMLNNDIQNILNINIKAYPVHKCIKTLTIDNTIYILDYFISNTENNLVKITSLLNDIKNNKLEKDNWNKLDKLIAKKYINNKQTNILLLKSIKGIISLL